MTDAIFNSNLCQEIFQPAKLSDFNVLVTNNRNTGTEMYYFTRKFRKIDVWGDSAFGGNITSMQLALNCDHVVEKTGSTFKVVKCRADREGATALRLMSEYLGCI